MTMGKGTIAIIVIVVIIVIIAIGIFLYFYNKEHHIFGGLTEELIEYGSSHEQPLTAVLFYADWCGHSKAMMPEWKRASQTLSKAGVTVKEFEHNTSKDFIMNQHVDGYPTIRVYPNGLSQSTNYKEYTGNRSANDIVEFVLGSSI